MLRAGESSRVVLPSVVCLNMIVKPVNEKSVENCGLLPHKNFYFL